MQNLRFELLENGKRTHVIYHDGELLHEEGGKENRQIGYHLGAGIEAFSRGQETYYYQQDEQLSTAFITGRNGAVHNSYQYDAFGNELQTAGQLPNRIRYTGQQYDDATGQYYLRARYYNPVLGRFMQEDTYQGDGLNLYAYCKNNPVTYYDSSGYCGENSGIIAGDGEKTNFDNEILRNGFEWNEYLKEKYGADNVHWKISSVDDIFSDPTRLKGYTADELQKILGNDWTRGIYGSSGGGWKLMKGDISVFYHPGGGKHGGSYYGISSSGTGKIKVVNPETYIPLKGDKATIIYD